MTDTQPRKIRKVSTQEQIEDYEKLRQRIKIISKMPLKVRIIYAVALY